MSLTLHYKTIEGGYYIDITDLFIEETYINKP